MGVRWKLMCPRLYGITVLQTYIYYKENPKDLVRVKVLVSVARYPPQTAFLTDLMSTSRSVWYCK